MESRLEETLSRAEICRDAGLSESVMAIAVACGFGSLAHFSRSYRDWAGKPPREER